MTTKQIKEIESYFQTNNEHYNEFTFDLVKEAMRNGIFNDLELSLKMYDTTIEICLAEWKSPLKAIGDIEKAYHKAKLTTEQQLFILDRIKDFLIYTSFEDKDLSKVLEMVKIAIELREEKVEAERQSKVGEPDHSVEPIVKDLNLALKTLVHKELEALPNSLEAMKEKERLDMVLKLLPYVMPKMANVHCQKFENQGSW